MYYREEKRKKRIMDRTERESIEYLQMQHIKDKNNFKSRIHTMHPEQIKLEYLLLNLEEQVYFKNRNYNEDEMNEIEELLFINNQSCCNLKFGSFNEWTIHLNSHSKQPIFMEKKEEEKEEESKKENEENIIEKEEIKSANKDKKFKCDVENCKKAYTSAYGLRYHKERGHKDDEDPTKPFVCMIDGCKIRYKNANGLKYHVLHFHK